MIWKMKKRNKKQKIKYKDTKRGTCADEQFSYLITQILLLNKEENRK